MNLIMDSWLPVKRKNGEEDTIALFEITSDYQSNPVIDVLSPRPDLKSALYQLIIGVLQVTTSPSNSDAWKNSYITPLAPEVLKERFSDYEKCFIIDNPEGPAFMQDYDWKELQTGSEVEISGLFIDAPGANTNKENKDHFIKRGLITHLDPYWAAVTLYALQAFAPAGGQGHRVGLRGGGPLTILVLPNANQASSTLWEKLWLNIFDQDSFQFIPGNHNNSNLSDIFPWMAKTRTSNKNEITTPDDCHPLQMYFGMPRRIRLNFEKSSGSCSLTNQTSENLLSTYKTLARGINYDGPWLHPFDAYTVNPKKPDEPPLSLKGQPSGLTYRLWPTFNLDSKEIVLPKTCEDLEEVDEKLEVTCNEIILWVSGYDMDNAKARCWYDAIMPHFIIAPDIKKQVTDYTKSMLATTIENTKNTKAAVKSAWFKSPKDAKGDMSFIDRELWQNTEGKFYQCIEKLINKTQTLGAILSEWELYMKDQALHTFDKWALSGPVEELNMERILKAKSSLKIGFKNISKKNANLKTAGVITP